MKKTLKMLFGFLCLLSAMVFALSGCDMQNMFGGPVEVPKEDGVTPVYYGMLMSTSPNVEIPSVSYEEAAKGNTNNNGNHNGWYKDNNGNNGNHYGWYKDDNGDGKLDDDFQQQICYVSQNQDVYFYVGIGNPAGLQIVSIKINGKTYTSDMFEKNSTNEVKILKYNVGNAHGIVEYTIEEIKYSDGTEVKDVVVAGNKTARAGIKIENAVMATVNTIELKDSGKEIFFDITIADDHGLIANSNGTITITIYRDGKSVKDAKLVVGENEVTIKTLNKNKEHQYEIVAYYDDLLGEGATYHTLVSRRPVQEIHTHTFGDWTVTKEASCFVDGEKIRTCSVCGEIETEIISAPDKHTWGEWEIVKDATCVEDGAKKHTCSACGEIETETIKAPGKHTWGEWAIVNDATCTEDGEKMRTCSACDATETDIIQSPRKHSWGEWQIIQKASCTKDGEKTRTCSACDATETETIPALGHNYVNLICSECGKTASCEDGHSYQIDLFNNPARFENRWGVCEFCGYIDELHEHILQNGKCKYCKEFELYEMQVKSVFDFDKDGQKDVFTMANTLPEKFRAEDAIHISASKANLSEICTTYDEVRAGRENPMPYVHHFVNEQDKENSYLLYKITVEEAGIYELGIHIRLKDARYRGATFWVNGTKALEFSYGWTSKEPLSLSDAQLALRSNDLLKGSYIYGITIELEKGENVIKITSPEECSHSMHFRDFYFVKKQTTPPVEHEHEWVKSITPPTAMANGVITYTCSCGESYTETIVPTDFTITAENRAMIGFTGEANEKLVIPAVFEDNGTWYRVTSIGICAFYGCSGLASVTIPDTVATIDGYAFGGCSNLTSVTIGDSVTTISGTAFWCCSNLTSVIIPDSVTTIGYEAFAGCSNLTSVTIGKSVTTIGESAFRNCSRLTSIVIDEKNIAYQSINGNLYSKDGTLLIAYALGKIDTHFQIPDSVTTIGDWAFSGCSSLTSVTVGDSVTSIGDFAFCDCDAITHVYYVGTESKWANISIGGYNDNVLNATRYYYSATQPTEEGNFWHYVDGVPTVWEVEIHKHSYTSTVTKEPTATENGVITYTCSCTDSYTEELVPQDFIITPDNRAMIGFTGEANENFVIPAVFEDNGTWYRVTTIGNFAFSDCSNITNVTIGNSVTTIGNLAFYYCSSLTSVTIGNSVTTIGDAAFSYCSNLTSVTIPDSVTAIGSSAFSGCSSLTSVKISDFVTIIGDYTFSSCSSLTSVTIPNSVTIIGDYTFSGCSSLTSVTIPNSVTTIGSRAFSGCFSLASVTIGDSVTTIGSSAFQVCSSLTSVTIPNSVTIIGDWAFAHCDNLTSVTIPDSVTIIGDWAFAYCNSLTSLTIGNSVTTIGDWAFAYCNSLTSLTIGNSVTTIGDYAFYSCYSLTTVYYIGTEEDWNNIAINNEDNSNSDLLNATRYYYSATQPTTEGNFWHYVDGVPTVWDTHVEPEIPDYSEGLEFISNGDGTCYVLIYNCKDSNVKIPYLSPDGDTVTAIKTLAIGMLSPDSVFIPQTVTHIDSGLFGFELSGCKKYIVAEENSSFKSIEDTLYSKDGKTLLHYAYGDKAHFTIPDGVEFIGANAFWGVGGLITNIVLPNDITSIGRSAFNGCHSLTHIYYMGTEETWIAISIDEYNTPLTNATRYYYSETQPTTEGNYWHYVDGVPTAW